MSNYEYNQQSISSLKGADQVRKRPAVIFGTDDALGCAHGIFEIIANSVDEAREGHGSLVKISVFKDGTVEVIDSGRGVPMGWNESEGKFNWELVFCTMYASGKYDSANYGSSLGLNGLGATATQYASEFMVVESTRNGETSIMKFEKGVPVGDLQVVPANREGTGTLIRFKPDMEVFSSIDVPEEYYIDKLRRQAMTHPGLEFDFFYEKSNRRISLIFNSGAQEYIDEVIEKRMLSKTISFSGESTGYDDERNTEPYKVKMNFAFNFSRESAVNEIYHNGSYLSEGGVTADAIKNAVTGAFDDHCTDIGKLGKSDKIIFRDIESILVCIGDTNCPGNRTAFKNQTKLAIGNPFIKKVYTEFIYHNMRNWLRSDKVQGERVINEVLANKQAREEADKISKRLVQSLNKGISGIGNKVKKFVDCSTQNIFDRELYIVEGDSALGACKLSRNATFQAIMPVRGKILNCLKKDLTKILKNEIIVDLIRVLGCGIEARSNVIKELPPFDMTKLRWGKVIICTDADLDGMQIRCLIITCIYRLCPTLLKQGKVYIAETPLFEITAKGKTYFAYNQPEKDTILAKLKEEGVRDTQIKIQRSKGLGENDPDMMSVSTMHPKTRRLVPVDYPEDDSMVADYFNALLGDDIEARKELINAYFAQTKVDID